jgi:hypothetical protein
MRIISRPPGQVGNPGQRREILDLTAQPSLHSTKEARFVDALAWLIPRIESRDNDR